MESNGKTNFWLPLFGLVILAAMLKSVDAQDAPAVEQPAKDAELGRGRLIRVRLPLVGNADRHVKRSIQRTVAELTARADPDAGRRPVLILELVPGNRDGGDGRGTEFARALSLAEFLSTDQELTAVKTVAYIPQTIKGHGVLVAMACEDIVMDADVELGDAGADEPDDRPVGAGVTSFYQQIASARLTIPEALALGMLDARLEVLKVETEDATEFVLADELSALQENKTIVAQETLIPAGTMGRFTGREGREFGFVKYLADDSAALARVLRLPPEAVIEDQALVGDWRPVLIDINGPITPGLVSRVKTLIGTEMDQRRVNWIGLRIDSTGGDLKDCLQLATEIAGRDPTELRTVAYVPVEASGGAAVLALACDQLVLQPAARLGGVSPLESSDETLASATSVLRESLSQDSQWSWSLLAALLDPQLEVCVYTHTKTGEVRYFSVEEAEEQPDTDQWRKGPAITTAGELLDLDSRQAVELGIAWQEVDSVDELNQLYGFDETPRVAELNWALELVEALASPPLAVTLLVIGFLGIYIELHTPGVGIGGFLAAVAFLLFFWSKFLHGTAEWLEILLFVGGVFFILMEIFVLPGVGIFGLGGGTMIIASLVLASQTFILPRTASELIELRKSLTVVVTAAVGILGAALVLRRYLPQAPILRTLLLNPPAEEELADLDYREAVADFSHLVGERGQATTGLMPAGKALIGGQLIDVIADGDVIERDQTVEVVSVRGNRVMVRSVDA